MAVTFRDFFIGLSEQAPLLAQLAHDYTIWNYKKGMAEREFGLKKMATEADIAQSQSISKYYEGQLGVAQSKEERDKVIFPIELHTAELEQDTARMANETLKATKSANVELFGGDKEAAMKLIQMDYEERQKKIDQLDAEINQAKQSGDYYNTNRLIVLAVAKRNQFDIMNKSIAYTRSVALNPEEEKKLEGLFSRVYNSKTGEIDDAKFFEEIQQIKTMPVWKQNALSGIVEASVKMAYNYDAMIDEKATTAEMNLYSTDKATKEMAHNVFGYKVGKLDLTKPDEVMIVVDNWVKYQKNQTKMKKYRSFISYITSSMEGMNIPLPGYDEEIPIEEEEKEKFIPDTRVGEPFKFPDTRTPYEKETEETWRKVKSKKRTSKSLYGEF